MGFKIDENGMRYLDNYYSFGVKEDEFSKKVYHTFKKGYNTYYNELLEMFCEALDSFGWDRETWTKILITCVPSHEENGYGYNITRFIKDLCDRYGMINCSDLIRRHTFHQKSTDGGDRSPRSHIETMELTKSIATNECMAILVLDDITTTGGSLIAAKTVLAKTGKNPDFIHGIAIAKTSHI